MIDLLLPIDKPIKGRKPVYGLRKYPDCVEDKPTKIIIKPTDKKHNKDPKKIIIDWSPIIGYEHIKKIIDNVLTNKYKKKTHLLIIGAAGTSKTVFLKTVEESLLKLGYNVHYLDATTLSSSGVIEYLFNHDNVEYLLLDEIDKLEKEHQYAFLNLCEIGILQETKHRKIRKKEMFQTIILATGNYLDKIIGPLKTRFMLLNIPEYTKQQFFDISIQLLQREPYNKTKEIANYITGEIWRIYVELRKESPNIRNCKQVAAITNNEKTDIDMILKGLEKYSIKVDVE